MTDQSDIRFRGMPLYPWQLNELASAWRPVGGVLIPELKKWSTAANLDEGQEPSTEAEWRDLAGILDRWVRSPAGRAYGADDRGPAFWEVHLRGFEVIDPEAAQHMAFRQFSHLRTAKPRVAHSLSALADLHPWVAWMPTANRAFPDDVVPRMFVRELGVGVHAHGHHPAWAWDNMLRDAGVDPLGEFQTMSARALEFLRDQIDRIRGTS